MRRTLLSAISVAVIAASSVLACSAATDPASATSSSTTSVNCDDYVAPNDTASCNGCSGSSCQANGCYGGRWCKASTNKCEVLPKSCGSSKTSDAGSDATDTGTSGTGPVIIESFDTPSAAGLQPAIDAINSAQSSIYMEMYHLTVTAVADALVAAAGRGVTVKLIIDQTNWNTATTTALKDELTNGGVSVTPSSTAFRITHVKSFVVDGATAYIMSLNLTSPYVDTRDYAVATTDMGIVSEFVSVFNADLVNAANATADTPPLSSPYLAWSPVNSEDRLVAFVVSDDHPCRFEREHRRCANPKAMIAAAARGVDVRILAPMCNQNADRAYDLPYLTQLSQGGVDARAMPAPPRRRSLTCTRR